MILSTELKNSRVQLIADAIDAGNATLQLKNEAGEVICELLFANPCQSLIDGGTLTFKNLPESMVLFSDTIASAVILDQDSGTIVQVTVGIESSSADLKLPSLAVIKGSLLRISGWTIGEL